MKFPNKAFFLAAIICLSLPNQLKSAKTNTESSTEHNVHGFAHHVHGIAHHVPRYARSVVHQHVQGRVIPEVPIMPVAEVPVVSSLVTPLPILHKRSELITPLVESPVRHDIVKPLLWVEVVQNSCGSCSNNSCNSCASSCESRCPFQMPIRPQGSCMRCVRRCSCSSSSTSGSFPKSKTISNRSKALGKPNILKGLSNSINQQLRKHHGKKSRKARHGH